MTVRRLLVLLAPFALARPQPARAQDETQPVEQEPQPEPQDQDAEEPDAPPALAPPSGDEGDDLRPAGLPDWVADAARDRVGKGEHWRFDTPNGVVHVWRPDAYDPRTAGTVVYLHGHGDSADSAFTNHRLAQQFEDSARNALYLVPEAPPDGEEDLYWESLGALRRAMAEATGLAVPPGELVVMGHSGAFRSIVPWLDDKGIGHIILLDALYGNDEDFAAWISRSPGHARKKLTLVSYTTRGKSDAFVKRIVGAVKVPRVPPTFQALTKRQREAQVLYLRSQYPHMEIVTQGKVIPLVLQRTTLPKL